MRSLVTSGLISAAANVLSLGVSAKLFGGFSVEAGWFVVAVVLFTVLTVALQQLAELTGRRFVRTSSIAGGLLLTLVALFVTDTLVPHRGFEIEGWGTWIGVTVLVWAAGVAYGEIDRQPPPGAEGASPATSPPSR